MKLIFFEFTVRGDDRGSLIAVESERDIPFAIRRVYYIFGTKEHTGRGMHAHRKLEQVLVCTSGACTIILDDGIERESVILDSPARGLYIGPMVWREMRDFSSDCVLMVLASEHYDADDYIRDYAEFKNARI